MTLHTLALRLKKLPATTPSASEKQQQWLGWVKECDRTHHYKNGHATAEYLFNHLHNAEMILWLAKASGVSSALLTKAKKAEREALQNNTSPFNNPTRAAAVRRIITWKVVEAVL